MNDNQYTLHVPEVAAGFYTVGLLAARLGISPSTVLAHRRRGTLAPPAFSAGRMLLWTEEQVEAFERHRRGPGRPRLQAQSDPKANADRAGAKAFGAFYTPEPLAIAMAHWIGRGSPRTVLEPSVGDGEFVRALNIVSPNPIHWRLHEIDPAAASQLTTATANGSLLFVGDFLASDDSMVDAVIGNPPFVRLRSLPPRQARSALDRSLEAFGSKMENGGSVWLPFVTHSTKRLKNGGCLALVLPWELTHVRYARPIWKFLGSRFGNLRIVRFRRRVFPRLSQDVVVLFAEHRGGDTDHVLFETFHSVDDLTAGAPDTTSKVSLDDASSSNRPFQYSLIRNGAREEAVHILSTATSRTDAYARFHIGYVSGSKSFFHPSVDTIRKFNIPTDSLIPTLADGKSMRGAGLFSRNLPSHHALWKPGVLTSADQMYVREGERQGINGAYKCRVRRPWYSVPDVRRPELLLSVFSDSPSLMVNDGGISASNSLLVGHSADPIGFAGRWYSPLTILGIELAVHSLGGGVFVFVPQEANAVRVWDQSASKSELKQIDQALTSGDPSTAYGVRNESFVKEFGEQALLAVQSASADLAGWRIKKRDRTRQSVA